MVFDVVEQQLAELVELDGVALGILDQRSVVGVALTYANGLRFPPPRATLHEAPPFLLVGPGPGLRGAWVDAV